MVLRKLIQKLKGKKATMIANINTVQDIYEEVAPGVRTKQGDDKIPR